METISAANNWRLVYRACEGGVELLCAQTCDEDAALPEEIHGLPVLALAAHCMAPDAKPAEGEELCLTCGRAERAFDNRALTRLRLPESLRRLGGCALRDLRELETLCLSDGLTDIGGACFMNCRSFSRLELRRVSPQQGPALAEIVSTLPQELDVTIREPDGERLRLIFPAYTELYEENSPAHHFDLHIDGAGYPYHSVFRARKLSLEAYDALFPQMLAQEHEEAAALRLAYWRLRLPGGLTEAARARYAAYLDAHLSAALSYALREKDLPGLRLLLALPSLRAEQVSRALAEANQLKNTEAAALLLEHRRRFATGRKDRFRL